MFEPISTKDFNSLLHMCIDATGADPKKTYIEMTWWDGVYLPLTCEDCDRRDDKHIMVFGQDKCQTYPWEVDGYTMPTGFYIWKNATSVNQVVHRPSTVSHYMDSPFMLEFKTSDFLIANSPVNYHVEINPFRTRMMFNADGDTILALHVENRDSGEWRPFSEMNKDRIVIVKEDNLP